MAVIEGEQEYLARRSLCLLPSIDFGTNVIARTFLREKGSLRSRNSRQPSLLCPVETFALAMKIARECLTPGKTAARCNTLRFHPSWVAIV